MALPASTSAQTVSVNGTNTSCTAGTTQLTVSTTGDITISCTVSGVAVFSCSATATPSSIQSGTTQTSTIQAANCTNGTAATYSWTIPGGITSSTTGATTAQNFVVTAPAGLTSNSNYGFPVTVTASGGATWSGSASLLVTAASTGGSSGGSGGSSGCASSDGTFVKNGQFNPVFTTGQVKQTYSYLIPSTFMAANNVVQLISVQNTGVQNAGLPIELAISPCPGDFTSQVPPNCLNFANAEAGQLWVATSSATGAKYGTSCVVSPPSSTAPYYLNVRTAKPDGTNSCMLNGQVISGLQCSFIVQLHWAPS
ncbi:MAG TPA: hypothetical protein VKR38_01735 [Usitatibacter sp.]|nr:hypothetical protein [Usitatibacter sp.]